MGNLAESTWALPAIALACVIAAGLLASHAAKLKLNVKINEAKPMNETTRNKKLPEFLPLILLAVFGGMLGLHRFYAGKGGTALLMLLMTVSFLLSWVTALWLLVDIIVICKRDFRDGEGNLIR